MESLEANPISKPKSPKLWKKRKSQKLTSESRNKSEKKPGKVPESAQAQKTFKKRQKFAKDPLKTTSNATKKDNIKLSKKKKVSFSVSPVVNEDKKSNQQQKLKRKNVFDDSQPKKKVKPDGIKRKDWKILRMDKKKVPKEKNTVKKEKDSSGKVSVEHKTGKEWKMIHLLKKGKQKVYEESQSLKTLWEELRREDCKPERKSVLIKQACTLLKGKVKEFTFAHDTVRVLECIVAEGTETDRSLLFDELKDDILLMAKSKYGKFFLLKMLKYGSKQQKDAIMKAFHGKVVKLLKHTEAAEVVEMAFNECANAPQRFEFVQEFYGSIYKYFKTLDFQNLEELFTKEPEKRTTVIQHMKEELLKLTEKSVIKHSICHHILWQFMCHSDPASRAEVIESVRDAVPEILHTKDGSRAAMQCVWFGTIKDRKVIVKSMRTFVAKIAKEEHGHMVLLALFDCVDDTKLIGKFIVQELVKNITELSRDVHGKKVLIYLLNHRDSHFLHPDVIKILQAGDNNENSKKSASVRQAELKELIEEPLLEVVKTNFPTCYTNNAFCFFAATVLQHTVGKRAEVFKVIAESAVEPYMCENKSSHVIESIGSNLMLKKLIVQDKETKDQETFSEFLISAVPKLVFKSWVECNRGAFLLVFLLETEIPSVVDRVKEDLTGMKKYLMKNASSSKGVEVLLKKLKN